MKRSPCSPHRTVCCWNRNTEHPAAYARECLLAVLGEFALPRETVEDLVLAVSELAANASQHAPGPYELRVRSGAGELIVEVHDRGQDMPAIPLQLGSPQPVPADTTGQRLDDLIAQLSERGRGLALVHSLMSGCLSARRTPTGKAVWVAVGMDTRPTNGTVR